MLESWLASTASVYVSEAPSCATLRASQYGTTALMAAAQHGHTDVVVVFLEHGARVDRQNKVCVCALLRSASKYLLLEHECFVAAGCTTNQRH